MSAPFSGAASGNPISGYYPDPSIPGYVRYWNGSAWVPGTSRPEPREGEPMPAPPSAALAASATAPPTRAEPAPAEETGPIDLGELAAGALGGADEAERAGPAEGSERAGHGGAGGALPEPRRRGEVAAWEPGAGEAVDWDDPSRLHGLRPESGAAWQPDAAPQGGFSATAADPRGGWGRAAPDPAPDASAPAGQQGVRNDGTFQMRTLRPGEANGGRAGAGSGDGEPRGSAPTGAPTGIGTGSDDGGGRAPAQQPEHTVGLRRSDVLRAKGQAPAAASPPSAPQLGAAGAQDAPDRGVRETGVPPQQSPAQRPAAPPPPAHPAPEVPGQQAPPAAPFPAAPAAPAPPPVPPAPPAQGPPHAAPGPLPGPLPDLRAGAPGQGAPPATPWTQQVHDLAAQPPGPGPGAPAASGANGGLDPVIPWRPPSNDPFLQAASRQQGRPAALGRRFAARLVDAVLTAAVAGAVAFPFVGDAVAHVQDKMDAVRQAGRTEQVWLIDGTTGGYLAVVLGTLLLFGLLYEALPTWRWGCTLGKKLFGLRVLSLEGQGEPALTAALVRWLVYGVSALLVVGVANVLWGFFDRPWRQCWHDKLARTFVSEGSGEIRLRR